MSYHGTRGMGKSADAPSSYELGASSKWRKILRLAMKGKKGVSKSTASHRGFSDEPAVFDS